jgi:hypothetical protein
MSMAGTRWLRTRRARRLLSDLSSRAGEERSSVAIKMLFHHVAVEKLGQVEEGPTMTPMAPADLAPPSLQ